MNIIMALQQFDTNSPADKTDILFCNWPGQARYEKGVCFIPADLSAVAHVRGYIESITQMFGLSEQSVFELALVADELVANAILASFARNGAENIVLSTNALAAPTGSPLASTALLTTVAGGIAPIFVGMWGAVDLIRDPYSEAASGGLRLTALTTADVTVARGAQSEILTGVRQA